MLSGNKYTFRSSLGSAIYQCLQQIPKEDYLSAFSRLGKRLQQEAHGPRVAHLSDIATADMQMLCNIFPILPLQLMKRSSFKQFLILKKNIYGMTVNGS